MPAMRSGSATASGHGSLIQARGTLRERWRRSAADSSADMQTGIVTVQPRTEQSRETAYPNVNRFDHTSTAASTSSGRDRLAADLLNNRPSRVLHLVSSGGLYGAEQVILNLARSERLVTFVGALYNVHSP